MNPVETQPPPPPAEGYRATVQPMHFKNRIFFKLPFCFIGIEIKAYVSDYCSSLLVHQLSCKLIKTYNNKNK